MTSKKSILKGIQSLQARIEEHLQKILDAEESDKWVPEIDHWKKEIENFQKEIIKKIKQLQK